MAPVEKRAMIAEMGSTSSIGTGPPAAGAQSQQAAQGRQLLGLVVDGGACTP